MVQLIIGGYSGTSTSIVNNAVTYQRIQGAGASFSDTEANRKTLVPTNGYFKNLRVIASGVPGAAEGWTFYVRINGVDSALSCAIMGASQTSAADMTHKARATPGQSVVLKCANTATPTARTITWSVVFVPDNPRESIYMGGVASLNHVSPNTYYEGIAWDGFNGPTTTADAFNINMPMKGKLKKLYVEIDTAPAGAASWTFTLRKTGASQTVTVTITGAATSGNDTTHVDTVAAGDKWGMVIVPAGAPATFGTGRFGLVFEAEQEGYSLLLGVWWSNPSAAAVGYEYVGCQPYTSATETAMQRPMQPCRISNLYVNHRSVPGVGKSYVYVMRRNSVSTPLTCTLADNNVVASDNTHNVFFRMDENINLMSTPANSPAAGSVVAYSSVCYIEPNQTLLEKTGTGHGARIPQADNQGTMLKLRTRAK